MPLHKSEDTERDFSRALKWFGEAVPHSNQDVETLWGFGTSATYLGRDLDLAETALIAAYQRAPKNPQIALVMAELKAKQDKPEEMIPFLKDVQRYATRSGNAPLGQ